MANQPIRPVIVPDTHDTHIVQFCLHREGAPLLTQWLPVLAWLIQLAYVEQTDEWRSTATPICCESLSDVWCLHGADMDGFVFPDECTCDSLDTAQDYARQQLIAIRNHQQRKREGRNAG